VAVHLACESLLSGESTLALAGGVNLNVGPDTAINLAALGALSPDGRCFTFDARANGFVRGEGGGVVVLKPLQAAVADGDSIVCVIRGSAVNNDGGGEGLTAPDQQAQERLLRQAYESAGVSPEEVAYVELHGTGTPLGDRVEAAALGSVLGAQRAADKPLLVGSAKTNVGHLEAAAGIVGLIKTALSITHGEIPASLNFTEPNPEIPLAALRLHVQDELGPWPGLNKPLLAGVSSFGIGGTNCHVVVGEPPAPAGDKRGTRSAGGARTLAGRLPWVVSAKRDSVALSGELDALDEVLARCEADGIRARRIRSTMRRIRPKSRRSAKSCLTRYHRSLRAAVRYCCIPRSPADSSISRKWTRLTGTRANVVRSSSTQSSGRSSATGTARSSNLG
jgi:acyl transferase domain-containing protein